MLFTGIDFHFVTVIIISLAITMFVIVRQLFLSYPKLDNVTWLIYILKTRDIEILRVSRRHVTLYNFVNYVKSGTSVTWTSEIRVISVYINFRRV